MKLASRVVALLSAAATIASANAAELTLAAVEQSLKNDDPRATLARYFDCGTTGNAAYDSVASGANSWLAVAVQLLPEADGCYSVSLRSSVARAMSVRPQEVLTLMETAPALRGSKVCLPFMSVDDAPESHQAYLVKLEAALRTVHVPNLQRARQACLTEVQAARARPQ